MIIERGGEGHARLAGDEAVEILMSNCEDAYGFPPYPTIAPFLHSGNGRDLRAEERAIVASALDQLPATLLRSSKMDWWTRLPAVVNRTLDPDRAAPVVPLLAPALPLAFE